MRTTLIVCAALALCAVGTALLAQDCPNCNCGSNCGGACGPACNSSCGLNCGSGCGMSCQECDAACGCNLRMPACGQDTGYDNFGCNDGQCGGGCNAGGCESGACSVCGNQQCTCQEPMQNNYDCDPYTYYQLREDWKCAHGPIVDTLRCLHNTCPKHHHCLKNHNGNAAAQKRAALTPWHGNYYYPQWGGPVALVVPPTAEFQTNYSWGVPASRISPIDAQFSRNYPGTGPGVLGGTGFLPPPLQPSDTNQFGVYYVRGPW